MRDQDNKSDFHLIGADLFVMFLSVAIFTTVLLVAIVFGKQYWKPCLLRNLFVRNEIYKKELENFLFLPFQFLVSVNKNLIGKNPVSSYTMNKVC